MIINFTKMHCLGNDFVVINAITREVKLSSNQLKKLADRHIGIGCDQIILLEPPVHPTSDFYYKIYNSDGTEAEQCINGARCAAKLAFNNALVNQPQIKADCLSGSFDFIIEKDGSVTAKLDCLKPKINKICLDFLKPNKSNTHHDSNPILSLKTLKINTEAYQLSIGNPHLIVFVDSGLEQYEYSTIAEKIGKLDLFKQGINIGFAAVMDHNIKLTVFERGSGQTLSCGSNAIAAYLVARQLNLVNNLALVFFTLGELTIKSENYNITVNSSVNTVFSGKFAI